MPLPPPTTTHFTTPTVPAGIERVYVHVVDKTITAPFIDSNPTTRSTTHTHAGPDGRSTGTVAVTAGDKVRVVVVFSSPIMVTGTATLTLAVVDERESSAAEPYNYRYPAPDGYDYHGEQTFNPSNRNSDGDGDGNGGADGAPSSTPSGHRFVYHRSHFYGGGRGDSDSDSGSGSGSGSVGSGVEADGSNRGAYMVNVTNDGVDATQQGRTRELTFTYTVAAGHGTSALKYTSGEGALSGNITSIHTDAAANLALPAIVKGGGLPVYLDPINTLHNSVYASFVVKVDTEQPR